MKKNEDEYYIFDPYCVRVVDVLFNLSQYEERNKKDSLSPFYESFYKKDGGHLIYKISDDTGYYQKCNIPNELWVNINNSSSWTNALLEEFSEDNYNCFSGIIEPIAPKFIPRDTSFLKTEPIAKRKSVFNNNFLQKNQELSYQNNIFSDIPSTYRFKNAVSKLKERGILNGYQDGTFKPDQGVTRAEFIKIVLEGQSPGSQYDTNCFNDVKAGTWFAPYVCRAKDAGWVGGYPDGGFHPNDNITQAEAMKIAFMIKQIQTEKPIEGPQWFWPLILKTKERGFLPNDILNQNQKITRGEVSELIWNIIK